MKNPKMSFLHEERGPDIDKAAFVHHLASVIGHVELQANVFVAPFVSVRGDEGAPIFIGESSNVQDGVVIHGLETHGGKNLIEVAGKKFSVHIGSRVSLAHQSQVHGPARVEDDCFIGMQAFVFRAKVGKACVIEPGAKVMGVEVAAQRYVPAGAVVKTQRDADALPMINNDYPLRGLNEEVVRVNRELAEGYRKAGRGS